MDRLQVEIARQRLESAAIDYRAALRGRHPGTIATALYELSCAADAFAVARSDVDKRSAA